MSRPTNLEPIEDSAHGSDDHSEAAAILPAGQDVAGVTFRPTWVARRGGRYQGQLSVGQACQRCDLTEYGRDLRQYRLNATDLVASPCAPLAAWLNVLQASPWKLGTLEGEVITAYSQWKPGTEAMLSTAAKVLDDHYSVHVVTLFTADEIAQALVRGLGPVAFGGSWYEDMELPALSGAMAATGPLLGGHAVAFTGADLRRGLIRVTNNLGLGWGQAGRGWLPLPELRAVMRKRFEAYTIVPEEPVKKSTRDLQPPAEGDE